MNFAIKSIPAAGLMALCLLPAAIARAADVAAPMGEVQSERLRSAMDRIFSPGRWRETSGYRSPAKEDELRRQGAGTVPAGHLSRHSLGSPDAPGAYDVVVAGMSPQSAAARLKSSGEPFARVVAEGAHGPQGPHLHIEPGFEGGAASAPRAASDDTIYLRVVGGRRNPLLARTSFAAAPKY